MAHQPEPFAFWQLPKAAVGWPLIAAGFILGLLNWMMPDVVTERVIGAIWLPLHIFVYLAAVEDFKITHSAVIFIVVFAIVMMLTAIGLYYDFSILHWILEKLSITQFKVNATFVLCFSVIWMLLLIYYVVDIWIRRRWIVTQGFLNRKILLSKPEEQVISSPYKIKEDFPDMMDGVIVGVLGTLLGKPGLAGDLVIMKEGKLVCRIHMVFGAKKLAERLQRFQAVPTEEQGASH